MCFDTERLFVAAEVRPLQLKNFAPAQAGCYISRMALTPSTMLPLGTAAPDFNLPDTNGKFVSLADCKDRAALLVIFMCNHCPYVVHIRAGLAELARDYSTRNVGVVG